MTNRNGAPAMVEWDIDCYEQLMDAAWQLDSLAAEQDTSHDASARRSADQNRISAGAVRQEAADLLSQYWVPRIP